MNFIRHYKTTGEHEDIMGMLTLENMQELIGGYCEVIHSGQIDLIVNENGRLLELPYNFIWKNTPLNGEVLVGKLSDEGLEPVSCEVLDAFHNSEYYR